MQNVILQRISIQEWVTGHTIASEQCYFVTIDEVEKEMNSDSERWLWILIAILLFLNREYTDYNYVTRATMSWIYKSTNPQSAHRLLWTLNLMGPTRQLGADKKCRSRDCIFVQSRFANSLINWRNDSTERKPHTWFQLSTIINLQFIGGSCIVHCGGRRWWAPCWRQLIRLYGSLFGHHHKWTNNTVSHYRQYFVRFRWPFSGVGLTYKGSNKWRWPRCIIVAIRFVCLSPACNGGGPSI